MAGGGSSRSKAGIKQGQPDAVIKAVGDAGLAVEVDSFIPLRFFLSR